MTDVAQIVADIEAGLDATTATLGGSDVIIGARTLRALVEEVRRLEAADDKLTALMGTYETAEASLREAVEVIRDFREGWRYIRDHHGDLYGVGWDRCQKAADAFLAKMEVKP